jgi:hypothetical protein
MLDFMVKLFKKLLERPEKKNCLIKSDGRHDAVGEVYFNPSSLTIGTYKIDIVGRLVPGSYAEGYILQH